MHEILGQLYTSQAYRVGSRRCRSVTVQFADGHDVDDLLERVDGQSADVTSSMTSTVTPMTCDSMRHSSVPRAMRK